MARGLADDSIRREAPVLPVVLHTGSYSWARLGTLLDLMQDADAFCAVTPEFAPLFVSLPDMAAEELEQGGYFGQVLALLKVRKARRGVFAERLGQTVTKLSEMKGAERLRRLELLSYVEALVYHAREGNEHAVLHERIDAVLRDDEARLEVEIARRTMADVHAEQAILGDRKRMLLIQLRQRWGQLPAEIEQVIEATKDANQLEEWLRRVVTVDNLDAVGIVPPS